MARNGSGVYSLPSNTAAVTGDTISSTKWNSLTQDIEADLNVDRPVSAGGTGASNATNARSNLGITGNLYAVTASAFALTILDDADAAAVRTTIGAGVGDMLKTDNLSGLANYGTARTNLGLAIGTNVQAYSARLADVAGLAVTDNGFIVGNGTNFVLETGATAQASLGYTAADVLTKVLTVDGAGSGLDADTLDGVQGSAFALLTGASFSGNVVGTGDNTALAWDASGNNRIGLVKAGGRAPEFVIASGAALSFVHTNQATITTNISSATYTERMTITSAGEVQIGALKGRPSASSETSGTLTSASANKTIQLTGNPTINNSVFSAGDVIVMYAGASARTITAGTITTMRLDGTATTGSRTLAARGIAVLFFVSSSEVIVGGGAVT